MKSEEPHAYSAYGYSKTLPSEQTLLGFNGEYAETPTSLYLLGAGYRAYSVILMRFVSPDNMSPFGRGGANTYAYCGGDPVNRVDPSGHFFRLLHRGIKGVLNATKLRTPRSARRNSSTPSTQGYAPPSYHKSKKGESTLEPPSPYPSLPSYAVSLPQGHSTVAYSVAEGRIAAIPPDYAGNNREPLLPAIDEQQRLRIEQRIDNLSHQLKVARNALPSARGRGEIREIRSAIAEIRYDRVELQQRLNTQGWLTGYEDNW